MRLTYGNALRQAMYDELKEDPNVVLFGEDIQKNLYGYTGGFCEEFGENRIINIPLSEASVVGVASGSAMCGMRPIVDLTVSNFLYVAMDQIANIASKIHYMSNGEYSVPITILCSIMSGSGNAAQHSDRTYSVFQNIPGLKVICPATPQDMYSMMRAAVQDDGPVLCMTDRSLFWTEDEVLTDKKGIIGKPHKIQDGDDITIVTVSGCLKLVREILPELEEENISAEIIDVCTVTPIEYDLIYKSVEKTGRVIICDAANRTGSVASEIASRIAQNSFFALREPIEIVTGEDISVPFAKILENQVLISKQEILKRIKNFNYK